MKLPKWDYTKILR